MNAISNPDVPENRGAKCVVVTGGIACGKTVITNFFKELGVPIFDTDIISRELTAKGQPLLSLLAQRFGAEILNTDGELNRRALRLKVFNDETALKDLNALTHPAIMSELKRRISGANAPYAIAVIPLFFEGRNQAVADRVLVIDVNEKTQLQRLMDRDNMDEETARKMVASQVPRALRREKADDLIETDDGDLHEIKQAVIKLHKFYLSLFKKD